MVEDNMSEEIENQQLSDETAELESVAEWQVKATEEEDSMGDRYDLPFNQHKEEMKQSSLHERRSHPAEQLDREIEEIREVMVKLEKETASKENLRRRKPTKVAGQQQQSR
jgi:hypothetical protein